MTRVALVAGCGGSADGRTAREERDSRCTRCWLVEEVLKAGRALTLHSLLVGGERFGASVDLPIKQWRGRASKCGGGERNADDELMKRDDVDTLARRVDCDRHGKRRKLETNCVV